MNKRNILEIEKVSFFYTQEGWILKDITLKVVQGEYLVIIGPNGGGKTTLLKIIAGLLKPCAGEIRYGLDLEKKGAIGYVAQLSGLDKHFPIKVIDVVVMGFLGQTKTIFYSPSDYKAAEENLDLLGLLDYKNQYIHELSGGQLQRVLIARSLVIKPALLLLDEPTSFVDSPSKKDLETVFKDSNHQGMTIILVSHDVGVISRNAWKIACINQQLYYHGESKLPTDILEKTYNCPVDMITHGPIPHRVFHSHE